MKSLRIILVLSSLCLAIILTAGICSQSEAAPVQLGSNYYEFVEVIDPFTNDNNSWSTANYAASNRIFRGVNGHLATITSQEENDFLYSIVAGIYTGFTGAWLGGKSPEGWLIGPESGLSFSYTNFGGVEPNNAGYAYMNIGDYVYGIDTGKWADAASPTGLPDPVGDPVIGYFVEYENVLTTAAGINNDIIYQIFQDGVNLGSIIPIETPETGAHYYDYRSPDGFPDFGTEARKSFVWLHRNTLNGNISIGFIHNKLNAGVNTNKLQIVLDGLPGDSSLDVKDDPGDSYSFSPPNAKFLWSFGKHTDGAVIGELDGMWQLTVTPSNIQGINSWSFAHGTDGTDRIELDLSNSVKILAIPNDHLTSENIIVSPNYEFIVGQFTQNEDTIQSMNSGETFQSVTLDIINPYQGLSVSISQGNPVIIEAGEVVDIPIAIDAGTMPLGMYDDILIKISTEDGETLYSNLNVTIVEPGTQDQPDLSINSQDIELTDYTLGDTATLQAVIQNQGMTAASNVTVQFFELGTLLGETVLSEVPANGSETATITIPIGTSEGDHLIQIVVDPSDEIAELDESNNEASKIVTWGTPSTNVGNILVTGSSPSTVYAGDLFTVSGKAVYDVYVDGVRYTDYVVKGGSVQITIKDDSGNEWIYGGTHTDINGTFTKYLQAPTILDSYRLSMTVTDKTFTGTRELVFQVVEKPAVEPEPPAPPTVTGTGYWTYIPSGGSWSWTWTSPPVNEPSTETDLRVFSEDIYFSNNNPDSNEDITFFAKIGYWATSTDIVAENVPVNFYVTYPGTAKEPIGSAIIPSLSVGSPDFGSRYVYGTWRNQSEGIYIFEVEIDPSYTEENMLNNAATRAIIVGEIESYQGIIQGQVTNSWGGVEDVIIDLYDADMVNMIGNTITDTNGHYLFDSVPVGDYQVHIVTPDEYEADAETKPTEVVDQEISVVDFFLTKIESLCGDLDHDGDVDGIDRNILRAAFGATDADEGFIEEADYDEDGNIDYSDYQLWYYCYKEYVSGL